MIARQAAERDGQTGCKAVCENLYEAGALAVSMGAIALQSAGTGYSVGVAFFLCIFAGTVLIVSLDLFFMRGDGFNPPLWSWMDPWLVAVSLNHIIEEYMTTHQGLNAEVEGRIVVTDGGRS